MFERAHERLRAARNGEKGFTLIELLIVIVILGILAGIVVFSVQFIQDRGTKSACQTDKKNVESAIEAYYAEFNVYPPAPGAVDAGANNMVDKGVLKEAPPVSEGITLIKDATTGIVSVTSTQC